MTSGKRLNYPINQVIDISIYDVADNCPAAMVRNGLPLTPSYTARALFGQQHSPLLDEIVSAFDNFEDSVSDEGVQISVTVSEENKHLLTHYTPLDELQTTSLGDSIGLDRFVNIHHDVLGETQPDHTDGEQDKDNLAIEVRCPVCLSRRKSIMCLPCTHMVCSKCIPKLSNCPVCRNI